MNAQVRSKTQNSVLLDQVNHTLVNKQSGQWVDIIDHWSIIDHFAEMVDILEFVVDISLKWSIFYSKISQNGDMIYLRT